MKWKIIMLCMFILYFNNVQANDQKLDSSIQNELGFFLYEFENIEIKYSEYNEKSVSQIIEYLKEIPKEIKKEIKEIVILPYRNNNIAGMVKNEVIYIYDFESYDDMTKKRIILHEVGHIWENYLRQIKLLDYELSDYSRAVKCDKNFITDYSKLYIEEKNRYSEDFADSVAEYLINKEKFCTKYKNRAKCIENLIINQRIKELKEKISTFIFTEKEECVMWNILLGLIMQHTYI